VKLKNRILLIFFIATIAAALATGLAVVFLIQLHGQITFDAPVGSVVSAVVIAVYLLSGLMILGLLNLLLSKAVVLPAVEREMLDNERSMLAEQLHHSQKMEAVGRLAGSIAHDFNNMLTIIDGYSSLIIANPESEETAQNAQKVVDAARKASSITRKLLGFGRKEQGESVVLDLNAMLMDTDKMLSRFLGERIELITKVSSEPLLVNADPIQLGQVLMNLSVNARDAMPGGGRIVVQSSKEDLDDAAPRNPNLPAAGAYAKISVHDSGHGIDPTHLDRIFEPFFTTKESGEGAGLGLPIVKSIVKQAGGVIDLSSKPGEGTTFLVYLPLVALEEEELAEDGHASKPAAGSEPFSATILLVEDDEMIRTLVAKTLEAQHYNILLANDGWDAAQIARKHEGRIDLLFTDVAMFGLGGAELAQAVRELYPEIEVLFMSGYSSAQASEKGVPPDAVFLEKPFTPDKAVAMVRQLLGG